MKKLAIVNIIACGLIFQVIGAKWVEPATCKPLGQGVCNACKNCKYCVYCAKNNGKCSVCTSEEAEKK